MGCVNEAYETDYEGDLVTIDFGPETIQATGGHPFWVVAGEQLGSRPAIEELPFAGNDSATGVSERFLSMEVTATLIQTAQEGRWVSARDLKPGDIIVSRSRGQETIHRVDIAEVQLTTYNFHVDELENYTVGTHGVLVHNLSVPAACKKSDDEACLPARVIKIKARCRKLAPDCDKNTKKVLDHCVAAVKKAKGRGRPDPEKSCPDDCCDPEILRPKYAPDIDKWERLGGKVKCKDGNLTYTDWQSNTVTYKNGFPIFKPHAIVEVNIEGMGIGGRCCDYKKANIKAGLGNGAYDHLKTHKGTIWHHHENGKTMQLVPSVINTRFGHSGGFSQCDSGGNCVIN